MNKSGNIEKRTKILEKYGANESEIAELITYNNNVFAEQEFDVKSIPLSSEAHINHWKKYLKESEKDGVFSTLKNVFIQLNFPIQNNISAAEFYRAATLRGKPISEIPQAQELMFKEPEKLKLIIHPTLAGEIPVIIANNRHDFVVLVQALTKKNEAIAIPNSMGACLVAGYNNWERIRQYRCCWEQQNSQNNTEADWQQEFKQLITHQELYQDKFIILSTDNYSNVEAKELGLDEEQWADLSFKIRLEHECTHYFTRRFLGSMRNNILDELIADYRGIVKAIADYRADWFLRFVGLESFPHYRQGGRLENYRGVPPLSVGAFKILQILVKNAAENLAIIHKSYGDFLREQKGEIILLLALTKLNLEELASESAQNAIEPFISDIL